MSRTSEGDKAFEKTWSSVPGVGGWFMEVNNQPLGKRFMVTSFVFFAIGGVLALLMRIQLSMGELEIIGPERFNQIFTMHGSTMMYLFSVPFLEGLALYLLPLMIGSRDVAFPRLSAFSYWVYLFGGILFYSSFFADAVPDAGWFAYTPLSGSKYSGLGVDFWLLGLSMVEVAGLAAGVEIVVTVLKSRAPGMTLSRMPLLVWTLLVSGVMILFAFTVLLVATVLLEMDRAVGTRFFDPGGGGSSLLWQHLFWFFGHPEVYIMFLPATGIVSMVVAAFARRQVAAYSLVVVAIVLIGFVSFGLWVHHMFVTGLPELAMGFFTAASLMIGVASGIQIFSWIATLWGTRPEWKSAFLWIIGFLVVFVLGGLTGVMVAVVPFDMQVHDTYFIVAHFHYVLIGGVVFPIFAGIHYWFPKFTGRLLGELLGRWSFWLMFVGFNLTFFPMHLMGLLGLTRRVYTYPKALGLDGMNIAASIGGFVMGAGFLVFAWNVWRSMRGGKIAGNDPWRGETLEWSVSSPPPVYSYGKPPVVSGRSPMWMKRDDAERADHLRVVNALDHAPAGWRATLATDPLTAEPQGIQYLSGPTFLPLLTALGLLVAMLGVLTKLYLLLPLGGLAIAVCLAYWLLPNRELAARILADPVVARSGLTSIPLGRNSTAWWGMLCFCTLLGVAFGTLMFCYFYLRLFSDLWPQQGYPMPEFFVSGPAFGALVMGGPMALAGKRALVGAEPKRGFLWFGGALVGALVFVVLWLAELNGLAVRPEDNAYGSIFHVVGWAMLGLALLAGAFAAISAARLRSAASVLSAQVMLLIQLSTMLWILVTGVALLVFITLYLSPYVL